MFNKTPYIFIYTDILILCVLLLIFILCPRIQELESQVSCGGLWRIVLIPTLIPQLGKLPAKLGYREIKLAVMHCKNKKKTCKFWRIGTWQTQQGMTCTEIAVSGKTNWYLVCCNFLRKHCIKKKKKKNLMDYLF